MIAAAIRTSIYYRCLARTIAPGSPVLADHPRTVNVREDQVIEPLNKWIGRVLGRENRDRTVATIMASQSTSANTTSQRERAKQRLTDAQTRLRRHQAAIEAGVNPAALVDAINDAERERVATKAELDNSSRPPTRRDLDEGLGEPDWVWVGDRRMLIVGYTPGGAPFGVYEDSP